MHSLQKILFSEISWKQKGNGENSKACNARSLLSPSVWGPKRYSASNSISCTLPNVMNRVCRASSPFVEFLLAAAAPRAAICQGHDQHAFLDRNTNSFQKDVTKKWYFYSGPPEDPTSLNRVKVFAGSMGTEMTEDIAHLLNIKTGRVALAKYKDGESSVQIEDNVRGKDVFIVAPAFTNDSWVELFLLVSAARRASAKQITVVVPFFGYARLDQRVKREPIAAADMARMLEEMGVDHLVSVDLHTRQLAGFFQPKISADNIVPWGVAAGYFLEQLKELKGEGREGPLNIVVVASHENHMKRAKDMRDLIFQYGMRNGLFDEGELNVHLAAVSKMRSREDHSRGVHRQLIGEVQGSICIVVDDLCDTGTTVTEAAELLKESGAEKVWAFATHGRFSADGADRVTKCDALEYLVCTDTIPFQRFIGEGFLKAGKIRQLSMAPIIAESIHRMHDKRNIDDLLYPTKSKSS